MLYAPTIPTRGKPAWRRIAVRVAGVPALALGTVMVATTNAYAAPTPTPAPAGGNDAERLIKGVEPSSDGMGTLSDKAARLLDNGLMVAVIASCFFILLGFIMGGLGSTRNGASNVVVGRGFLIMGVLGLIACGAWTWVVPMFYTFGKA